MAWEASGLCGDYLETEEKTPALWNHSAEPSMVNAAVQTPVMAHAWNSSKKIGYQNKFGILPLGGNGGSYPYASYNTAGNTAAKDYCMAVGAMAKGSTAHGWSLKVNGYDIPGSDSDWPNRSDSHQSPTCRSVSSNYSNSLM
ncbi:hypothetical protein OS493_030825 [Desmophyllum pertusum]|uniref:Uncharacterized protein n=1 Tax=Desmophyllum pertusum TaxID=174260 RepID=A0A9W9YL74_9CNID|nr:hypothetical protein OS493_030825 [Desmophyllum pertusum]